MSKYIVVPEIALKVLKLSGTDALVFSYIFGFKTKGYYGSLESLASNFNVSKVTISKTLQFLTSKNFLIKKRKGQFVYYWANGPYIQELKEACPIMTIDSNLDLDFDDSIFSLLTSKETLTLDKETLPDSKPDSKETLPSDKRKALDKTKNDASENKDSLNNIPTIIKDKKEIITKNESEFFDDDFQYDLIRYVLWKSNKGEFIKSVIQAVGMGWGLSAFESWVMELIDSNYRVTHPESFFKSNLLEHIGAKKDPRGIPIKLIGKKYYKTLWDDIEWSNWKDPESFKQDILNICNDFPMQQLNHHYIKALETPIRSPQVYWLPILMKYFTDLREPTNGKLELI